MIDGIGVSFHSPSMRAPQPTRQARVGSQGRMWLLALVPQESETGVYLQPWVIKPLSVSARQRAPALKRAGNWSN